MAQVTITADGQATLVIESPFPASTDFFTLEAGQVISKVTIAVEVPFDGTDPEITVGTAADPDLLHGVMESDLEDSLDYQTLSQFSTGSSLDIKVFLAGTGISVGRARVTVFFAEGA